MSALHTHAIGLLKAHLGEDESYVASLRNAVLATEGAFERAKKNLAEWLATQEELRASLATLEKLNEVQP